MHIRPTPAPSLNMSANYVNNGALECSKQCTTFCTDYDAGAGSAACVLNTWSDKPFFVCRCSWRLAPRFAKTTGEPTGSARFESPGYLRETAIHSTR